MEEWRGALVVKFRGDDAYLGGGGRLSGLRLVSTGLVDSFFVYFVYGIRQRNLTVFLLVFLSW